MIYPVLIIGAGGLGRVVMSQAHGDSACGREWFPVGYLDNREKHIFPKQVAEAIHGDPLSYHPRPYERFLPAIGDTQFRQKCVESLAKKGAQFFGLRTRVTFGERCIIGNSTFGLDSSFGPDCLIGDYSFIDKSTNVGHDVKIGNFVQIGVNVLIAGFVEIGDRATIHSGAMIGRGVKIGKDSEIGIGAVVLRDVPPNTLVLGNPARIIRALNGKTAP